MIINVSPSQGSGDSRPSLSVHYMASRLRIDTWESLKEYSARLCELKRKGRDSEKITQKVMSAFDILDTIEDYWAFPGRDAFEELTRSFAENKFDDLNEQVSRIVRLLSTGGYRRRNLDSIARGDFAEADNIQLKQKEGPSPDFEAHSKPYFETLVVEDLSPPEAREQREQMLELRTDNDQFIYDIVTVRTFEDALIAVLFNYNIQSCVIRYTFPYHSNNQLDILKQYLELVDNPETEEASEEKRGIVLGEIIGALRPELDLFLVTESPVEEIAGTLSRPFRRVFYRQEDNRELHLSILKFIQNRYKTPFFRALKEHSAKPTGVFHAMPISRGKSIIKSHWIQDFGKFYGSNIFLAETSATTGGLDSLLQPNGPLKEAQSLASRAFRSRRTFFVTNGTSTANKIVVQALCRPKDIVLVDRECHKSHHYALILSGAHPAYLDSYPLHEYSMYGGVPIRRMKKYLLDMKREGKLDRVRMVLLTNCTFDGLSYHPEMVMKELLAIKPDLVFLWDEAWSAFAYFTPVTRRRTAMESASRLRNRFRSDEYRTEYQRWKENFDWLDPEDEETWLNNRLMPDPERVKVRVYATHSTHKTLTAMRQGSMIHVYDQLFEQHVSEAFHEAYMTHTSTSPNYQILASLDVGRRQVELEGYELVQKSIELAMTLREQIRTSPLLSKYFTVLGPKDMIPKEYRHSGLELYYDVNDGWKRMETAWQIDEFALDPTRLTLQIGRTGFNGDSFKKFLMENFDIQINKTSRNTVLFMIHIGSNRGTIAQLIEVLTEIAIKLDDEMEDLNKAEVEIRREQVAELTERLPPLPNFSRFHPVFTDNPAQQTKEGDMRAAFFAAYNEEDCEFLKLDGEVTEAMQSGRTVVSASFVIPYPPGFPVLVPGQIISDDILAFLKALDVKEIHGYNPKYGLRVFCQDLIDRMAAKQSGNDQATIHPKG